MMSTLYAYMHTHAQKRNTLTHTWYQQKAISSDTNPQWRCLDSTEHS